MFKCDGTTWLTPGEQEQVVQDLIGFNCGLIKWDNNRSLPLKAGGKTDIYINLRDGRDNPESNRYLAKLYAGPLRRLGVQRFAEIPEAVSGIASLLAEELNTGYLTVREQSKAGRVSDAAIIGSAPRPGEQFALIDDVITTGLSKEVPYRTLVGLLRYAPPMVVLVDRQQGWRKKFAENGIESEVWAGMTLHDVRRVLVGQGYMQLCDPAVESRNPVIVGLDGKPWSEILPVIDEMRLTGSILKVNDLVFNEGIRHLLPELKVYARRLMVDLKLHDVASTVENACKHLRVHRPWAVTVHASGHRDMIRSAVKALEGTQTIVLGVTLLTSLGEDGCTEVYHTLPLEQVLNLAKIAIESGARGLVCSGEEVGELRRLYPDIVLVVPGVRSPDAEVGVQKRVVTPAEAMKSGATHIVMASQLLKAKEGPVAELARVTKDELGIVA